MQSIGIVGCGTIGRAILGAVAEGRLPVAVAGVASRTQATAEQFLATLPEPPPLLDLETVIRRSELVIEAAGGHLVAELAERAFGAGRDLMVISVGALLEQSHLMDLAREKNCRLLLPSGAIAGIDAIKGACEGEVEHVTITTRKPPSSIADAPYIRENNISLDGLKEETEIYSGPVREACKGFPANVNVAACVSLAGLGPDRTIIRILAVPGLERNCHTIEVVGEFGRLSITIENARTVENPATGKLTAMSIIRTIRDAIDPVRIGT